jgi:hypothetical protein
MLLFTSNTIVVFEHLTTQLHLALPIYNATRAAVIFPHTNPIGSNDAQVEVDRVVGWVGLLGGGQSNSVGASE